MQYPSLILIVSTLFFGLQFTMAAPSADTAVFLPEGKNRVHLAECIRYSRLTPEVKATTQEMTFAEAQTKGLQLCSRCPGSDTKGAGSSKAPTQTNNNKSGLFESWVNPAPDTILEYTFEPDPRTPLISMGPDGKLNYKAFTDQGDTVMDWSYTGYKRSEVPIPYAFVKITLEPLDGATSQDGNMAYPKGPDSLQQIQEAIDQVAMMPANDDGLRGAVLLKRGTYFVNGSLQIRSGVVLRGEGDGDAGTILIFRTNEGGGNAIHLGEADGQIEAVGEDSAVRIVDNYLPSGSKLLTLTDASQFKPGDYVHIRKTTNQDWIDLLGMGERLRHIRGGKEGQGKRPWTPEAYQFKHLRQVASIDGNTITLDAVLPQSIDQAHGGGDVYKVAVHSLGTHSGVEFLQIVSNYDTTVRDKSKDSDFINFRSAVNVKGAYDSWVRGCTMKHVSFAAVAISGATRQITVRDCKNLHPVGPKRGGNRYAFSIGGGTQHLFYNCYSEDGRHDFAIGSRETGPFAFVDCTAVRGGQSEPHHRWSTGILYDNVVTKDGTLAAINRGDSGSGHGWAAANTMFWNCDAKSIVVFDPETEGENNFAIGYRGTFDPETGTRALEYANTRAGYWGTPTEGKFYGYALMGSGYIESPDAPVEPRSLFIQQLIDRIGEEQAAKVLQPAATADQGGAEVLFIDSMTGDWQEQWFLDGTTNSTLTNSEGGLFYSGGTVTKPMDSEVYHAHHATLWTKQTFKGDIRVSFEMTRLDKSDYGNTLLYIHTQGIGAEPYVEDISEWSDQREISAMSKYFTNMNLLSLSFRHNLRARRYPLQSADPGEEAVGGTVRPYVDYIGMVPGKTYRVEAEVRGRNLTLRLHDKETGESYADHTWDMTQLEDGKEAPLLSEGRIGLRHMSTKQFVYKDFKVERL